MEKQNDTDEIRTLKLLLTSPAQQSMLLTSELHRHITVTILSEYDMLAGHKEPKRKMFGASGGRVVGQLGPGVVAAPSAMPGQHNMRC